MIEILLTFFLLCDKSLLLCLFTSTTGSSVGSIAGAGTSVVTRAASAEGGGGGESDVLLGVNTDDKRRDVDELLGDSDVAATDEDTSVVDGLGHAALENLSLETALEQVTISEGKHKIELVLLLGQDTDALETAEEGTTFEDAARIMGIEGQQETGDLTGLDEHQVSAPQLALVLQAELTHET